ncbi:MAG TPA: PQQ-binding-like beta-propeller repeat protein, partial [Thermoanaerobaculia bacterium]|nr:PQQ-binding-like beta-propeller repeat protein [Thermoanaerobaculia bacterium]
WRGPRQNGISAETGLPDTWSPSGQNVIWRRDFTGRSTPVVMDGRVYVNGRAGEGIDRQSVIAAFDAETGEPLWVKRYTLHLTTVPFNRVGWASPTGDPETGYVYDQIVSGLLVCLDRDGNEVWSRSLKEEYGRYEGYGGRTASPLIDEDRIVVSMISSSWGPLGAPRHRYYAFDKRTGEPIWISTPSQEVYDLNTQASPVVAVIGGRRLILAGAADGRLYALEARTGKKAWEFWLSKNAINVTPVVDGDVVYLAHSEENIDEATQGRVVAIDGTGSGDVTKTHELWRANLHQSGFPSPVVHDGKLYVVDNSANLAALEQETGEKLWELSLGTVGKGSPVWADGDLYTTELNGHFAIVRPSEEGGEILARHQLRMPEGRYAEVYGSPAVAYGRVYFTTEEGVYCLGDPDRPFEITKTAPIVLGDEGAAQGPAATLLVVPAEVALKPGESVELRVAAFDAKGRRLGGPEGSVEASWEAKGIEGALEGNRLAIAEDSGFQAGTVVAKSGDLVAEARVRVVPPLPWTETFEQGRRPWWIGGGRFDVRDDAATGGKVLVKPVAESGLLRSNLILGPPWFGSYTIQADVLGTQSGRRRSDGGVIANGYILELMGNHQRLDLRSWEAMLRVERKVAFPWEVDRWYTMKLRIDTGEDTATVRGKVWPKGEPEPEAWTVEAVDPHPVRSGSPGLTGYSPAELFFDNVTITGNRE